MKRILLCVGKMDTGGIETLIMNIYRKIVGKGIQFDFLSTSDTAGFYDEEIYKLGGKIFYMPSFNTKNPFKILLNNIKRKKIFKQFSKYDICHIHTSYSYGGYIRAKLALASGIKKVIVHSHTSKGARTNFNKYYAKKLNKLNIIKYACSLEASQWLFNDKNAKIIFNGIDCEKFLFKKEQRQIMRDKLKLNNFLVLCHVASFGPAKNHIFSLKVLKDVQAVIPQSSLILVGKGGVCEKEIYDEIIKMNLKNVIKLGAINNVQDVLSCADCLLLPSFYEGLGISAVEAQASGLNTFVSSFVPKIAKCAPNIAFLGIHDDDVEVWKNSIINMKKFDRLEMNKLVTKSEFNIDNVVNILCEEYLK